MSLQDNIEFVNTYSKQFEKLEKKKMRYQLPKGVSAADFRSLASTNGNNTQGTQYQIFVNSDQIVGDYIVEEIQFTVTINITSAGGITTPPFVQGTLAPRMLPIESATQTTQITINGTPVSFNGQNVLTALMSFNKDPSFSGRDLPCSMLDTFADLPTPAGAPGFESAVGALKNQMLDYFSSSYGVDPRFADIELVSLQNRNLASNTANQVYTFSFIARQPIITGITSLTNENSGGFLGATNIQINRTFVSNLATRLIEWAPIANTVVGSNGISAAVNSAKIYYTVYTAGNDFKLEYPLFYPVIDYGVQSSVLATAAVNPGAVASMASQTLALSVIPKCIYVWVAVANGTTTVNQSDAPGYQITNISLQFNGVSGQFSGMSKWQIYEHFQAKQGFNKSFYECGYANAITAANAVQVNQVGLYGSVLRIDASDLAGINWETTSVGCASNCNLSLSVQATNLSAVANTPTLFIQVVNDAMLSITSPTTSQLYKGILDENLVRQIRANAPYEFTHDPMVGGNIFKKIWNGVKSAAKWTYDHRDVIVPIARKLVGVGKHKVAHHKAAEHHAGALVTKRSLAKRLRGRGLESSDEESDEYNN